MILRHLRFISFKKLFSLEGGGNACFCHFLITLYIMTASVATSGMKGYEKNLDSVGASHREPVPMEGAALHWRQLHFLGERGTAPLEESAGVSLLCLIRFPGLGAIASPGSIGLRQASSHRLPLKVFPMYVNLGPRFRTVGAEVASVVIIEHHYTAFS